MSREIKFRAWDSKFAMMIENIVAYGNNSIILTDVAFNEAYQNKIDERYEAGVEQAGFEHECITGDLVIEQFTGLKDKNGKEIYEGDIVKTDFNKDGSHHSIQLIEFYEGSFGSRRENDHFRIPALYSGRAIEGMNLNYYEVIGNIHEQPELLTKN